MSQVAERYASALFEVAYSLDKVVDYKNSANLISKTLSSSYNSFFQSSNIEKQIKKEVVVTAYQDICDRYFLNFLQLLIDKGRFLNLKAILKEFNNLCNENLNIKVAKVYSAKNLTNEYSDAIINALSKKYDCKIELNNYVDESLISGYRIEINGELIDSSMKSRIDDMKQVLLKEGV